MSLLFFLVRQKQRLKRGWQLGLIAALCGIFISGSGLILGTRSIGPGTELINGLLFKGDLANSTISLARFSTSLLSYVSGCAGGIFAPSLAAGASLGSQIATLVSPENTNLLILLGMIGFLTGVTSAPFTAFVLVLEMTEKHSVIFPMMLTALAAQSAARLISSKSFYEHMKESYLSRLISQ